MHWTLHEEESKQTNPNLYRVKALRIWGLCHRSYQLLLCSNIKARESVSDVRLFVTPWTVEHKGKDQVKTDY